MSITSKVRVKCKHCGKIMTINIIKDVYIQEEIMYVRGKEAHRSPSGENWLYDDGSIVGYGGYSPRT